MQKFTVRVRIVDPHKRAIHEDQVIEAETGLDAMLKAQGLESNTARGIVSTTGADPLPAEPIIETKGEEPDEFEPEIKRVLTDEDGGPDVDELMSLRSQYKDATGKKAYHGWDATELRQKIAEVQGNAE